MLNLFKKKTVNNVLNSLKETFAEPIDMQATIEEIHNAFDSAQDQLLKEAYEIINQNIGIENKAALAERLGFVNIPVVKRNKVLVETKDQANLISYYKMTYPFQKFLTEQQLDSICLKYNLVYAPISNYIQDVPEKNLLEIANAKPIIPTDTAPQLLKITKIKTYYGREQNIPEITLTEEQSKEYMLLPHSSMKWDYLNKIYTSMFNYKELYNIQEHTAQMDNKEGLFIAAPLSHFDTTGLSKSGIFGLVKKTTYEVKDPIVFRYCRGGIQVLSKWGLEASDEIVINEINN